MGLSIWQLLLVVLVFVLLFGRGKIPALMSDVAAGIKSFKKEMGDDLEAPTHSDERSVTAKSEADV